MEGYRCFTVKEEEIIMNLDIKKIPFTYPGSYFTIHEMKQGDGYEKGVYVRTLHKDGWRERVLRIELFSDSKSVDYDLEVSPVLLKMKHEGNSFQLCFSNPNGLIFQCCGIGVRFTFINASQVVKRENDIYEINCCAQNEKAHMKSNKGNHCVHYEWDGDNCTIIQSVLEPGEDSLLAEGEINFTRNGDKFNANESIGFHEAYNKVQELFNNWVMTTPPVKDEYKEATELANYLNWSSVVVPYGNLKRKTMFASKVSMTGIWSWDHCFHAIGVMQQDPQLAWDQWMLMFDVQNTSGALPDQIDETFMRWGFYKPPVHGYMLGWMMNHGYNITEEHLKEAYEPLKKWTLFWLNDCDSDNDMVPEYYNGNDSGWDNSTISIKGIPFESPDLSTYLILSMDVLQVIAERIGRKEDIKSWESKKASLLQRMLEHFYIDGRLIGRLSANHDIIDSKSLILYIPLLLGDRLPTELRRNMIDNLKQEGKFLTQYGLATEELSSSYYEADGYWRGPIWAPSTFLICQGLINCGEKEFALELMKRFCDMAVKANAFPENFDAITGEALRDPALIWTSCIFIVFASMYLNNEQEGDIKHE